MKLSMRIRYPHSEVLTSLGKYSEVIVGERASAIHDSAAKNINFLRADYPQEPLREKEISHHQCTVCGAHGIGYWGHEDVEACEEAHALYNLRNLLISKGIICGIIY